MEVIEVDRPDRMARRHDGKSDPTDAVAAGRAALPGRANGVTQTRDGAVEAIRTLEIVYRPATLGRHSGDQAVEALIVTAPDGRRHRLRDGAQRPTSRNPRLADTIRSTQPTDGTTA